ncbi:MAG: sulfotransferase [Microcystaceae cyanobacterium]
MTKQPSFFIVGAPKSGTTALCKYLNRHPEIFVPSEKELNYFNHYPRRYSLEKYLQFFQEGENKICGEGTPLYLSYESAPQDIYDFNPDAKIIIMLREPVALLYSFHGQLLWNGSSEDEEDFQKALDLESERRQGKSIPTKCQKNPTVLYYREIVKFTEQIMRYWNTFGKEQVKIILFDDFKGNTQQAYQEVLEFLKVSQDFDTEFNVINARKKVRSRFIQDFYKYPPSKLLEIGKYLIPLPQKQRRILLENFKLWLKNLNKRKLSSKEKALSLEIHKNIQQEFIPEIESLSQLIDRDLSHWIL